LREKVVAGQEVRDVADSRWRSEAMFSFNAKKNSAAKAVTNNLSAFSVLK